MKTKKMFRKVLAFLISLIVFSFLVLTVQYLFFVENYHQLMVNMANAPTGFVLAATAVVFFSAVNTYFY